MAFDFVGQLRRTIESWLLSDNLGSSNYTDANITNRSFIESFGIEEMCLIEMYDDKQGVYFTPSIIGKCLSFKKKKIDGIFLEDLTKLIKEKLPKGYSLQIFSYGYKDSLEGHEFLISVSCSGGIEKEEEIDGLVKTFNELENSVKDIVDDVFNVSPSFLLDYINKIFFPEEQFTSVACPYYQVDRLIREQLIKSEDVVKVSCETDRINYLNTRTNKSYSSSLLGVQQYPILKDEKRLDVDFYNNVLKGRNADNVPEIVLISVGVYNPKEEHKEKPTISEIMSNRLGVYSFICCFSQNDPKERMVDNVEKVKDRLSRIDYKYSVLKNRQLGALSMLIPLHLDSEVVKQIEKMKVLHRVSELSRTDFLPLLFCLNEDKESE